MTVTHSGLGDIQNSHQTSREDHLVCRCGFNNKLCFVFSGIGTQYRLMLPEALAGRETDQWTGRRKVKMDSGQCQLKLLQKLLQSGPSCLLLDVESAKMTVTDRGMTE